jgi:type II secretory pathway component GspD/PulD (secretin)
LSLSSLTGSAQESSDFFFSARGATVGELAALVARHYRTSIVVAPQVADDKVSGNISGIGLEQSLEVIAFLSQSNYRKVGNIYYLGGGENEELRVYPRGSIDADLRDVLGSNVSVTEDKILVRDTETALATSESVLNSIDPTESIEIALLLVDISQRDLDGWNRWIDEQSTLSLSVTGSRSNALTYDYRLDWSGLGQFMRDREESHVIIQTAATVLSGQTIEFLSGEIIEREVYWLRSTADWS